MALQLAFPRGADRESTGRSALFEYVGLGLILVLFGVFLSVYFKPTFWHSDPNGYYGAAARLSDHGSFAKTPADDFEFVGRHWVQIDGGKYVSKYPPFFPAMAAASVGLLGRTAGLYLNALLAVLALLGIYFLARSMGLGPWALLACALLATNPVFDFWIIRHVSHAASICLLTWGFVAFAYGRSARPGWRRLLLPLLAGGAVGLATGVRYTNVLLALPLLLAGVLAWRDGNRRELIAVVVGLALPGIGLAAYHAVMFGSPLATGYASTGEQSAFGLDNLITNLRIYGNGIVRSGLGPLVVCFALGMLVMLRRQRAHGLFFVAWIVPLTLLMLLYYGGFEERQMTFLRFLLPLVVPAILVAVFFVRELAGWAAQPSGLKRAIGICVLVVQGFWGGMLTLDHVEPWRQRSVIQQASIELIRDRVPAGSAIFGHRQILHFLDYLGGYALYDADLLRHSKLERLAAKPSGRRPPKLPPARAELLRKRLLEVPKKKSLGRLGKLIDGHLSQDRRVFFVESPKLVDKLVRRVGDRWQVMRHGRFTEDVEPYLLVPSMTAIVLSPAEIRERVDLEIVEITGVGAR